MNKEKMLHLYPPPPSPSHTIPKVSFLLARKFLTTLPYPHVCNDHMPFFSALFVLFFQHMIMLFLNSRTDGDFVHHQGHDTEIAQQNILTWSFIEKLSLHWHVLMVPLVFQPLSGKKTIFWIFLKQTWSLKEIKVQFISNFVPEVCR
jgi:hypothetical protein